MKTIGNRRYNLLIFLLFIIPAVIAIVYAFYIPFIMNIYYGFTQWNGIQKLPTFNGIDNFKEIFREDDRFAAAALFTLRYGIFYISLINVFALFLAILLDKNLVTRNALRAAFYVPNILSLVIVGFIWKFTFMFGSDALSELTKWKVFQLSWLGDRFLSFYSVLFVSIWQSIGFYTVIYIAGLQSIPNDILEASTIDGAGTVVRFFRITLPMLMPSVTSCFFFSLISSVRVFDVIVSLTGAGPGRATASVTFDIYTEAFTNNRYGYATAKTLLLFVVVLFISIIQVRAFKNREVEV
ncbi:MAG: sugar ABC transporter permease [Spirochaetia bacterium]|jgi:raffinose/stachyose/melibiose transport system permease protein